jgi:hypothetical protein
MDKKVKEGWKALARAVIKRAFDDIDSKKIGGKDLKSAREFLDNSRELHNLASLGGIESELTKTGNIKA